MKRAIRIGGMRTHRHDAMAALSNVSSGASGSSLDRRTGFAQLAAAYPDDPVDVIIGDFMSEGNMTTTAAKRVDGDAGGAFDPVFVEALSLAVMDIAKYRIKVGFQCSESFSKSPSWVSQVGMRV